MKMVVLFPMKVYPFTLNVVLSAKVCHLDIQLHWDDMRWLDALKKLLLKLIQKMLLMLANMYASTGKQIAIFVTVFRQRL